MTNNDINARISQKKGDIMSNDLELLRQEKEAALKEDLQFKNLFFQLSKFMGYSYIDRHQILESTGNIQSAVYYIFRKIVESKDEDLLAGYYDIAMSYGFTDIIDIFDAVKFLTTGKEEYGRIMEFYSKLPSILDVDYKDGLFSIKTAEHGDFQFSKADKILGEEGITEHYRYNRQNNNSDVHTRFLMFSERLVAITSKCKFDLIDDRYYHSYGAFKRSYGNITGDVVIDLDFNLAMEKSQYDRLILPEEISCVLDYLFKEQLNKASEVIGNTNDQLTKIAFYKEITGETEYYEGGHIKRHRI